MANLRTSGMKCPVAACRSPAKIRTTKEISPTLSEVYYHCTNVACGCTFKSHIEFVKLLSPSGLGGVQQTVPMLRLKPRGPLSPAAPIPQPPDG